MAPRGENALGASVAPAVAASAASADAGCPRLQAAGAGEPKPAIGSVLVLGLGKSGKSVARYCAGLLGTRVQRVFVAAGARTEDAEAFLRQLGQPGFSYAFGDDALDAMRDTFDICIASPGIPFWHDLYTAGQRVSRELVSEVEFAWRESAPDSVWVAITGTNGKTTTTSCCAHILRECGFSAAAVGNIGDVCLDAVAAGDTQVYVAEVSSYQLASAPAFAPDIAVMLNITPDHLHWHRTFEAYRDAKFSVLGRTRRVAILDATNDVVRAKVRELKALPRERRGFDYIPLGTAEGVRGDMRARCGAENAAFLAEGDVLTVAYAGAEHALLPAADLQIHGDHNASNALAAAAVAVALGADDGRIARALAAFAALEHRIEPCGEVAGIACYNDSKATNVDATLVALRAFPGKRVAVLLGGDDKGTDLSDLVRAVHENARVAVCYGQAGPRFAQAFKASAENAPATFALVEASHMEDALNAALSACGPGDVVLLSPACASFDEFKSFEHRGEVFKRLVKEGAERAGAAADGGSGGPGGTGAPDGPDGPDGPGGIAGRA